MSEESPIKKKKWLSEDQWANVIAQGFKFPEPIDGIKYSLTWEDATMCFWVYETGCWHTISSMDITDRVRRRIIVSEPYSTSRGKDVIAQLPYEVQRYDVIDDGWMAFRDGSWNPVSDEFAPHSPSRFATVSVDADYGKLNDWKTAKMFSKFLSEICVHEDLTFNPQMAELLQEMFGYSLMAKSKRAVSFFLSGEGRNGKGVLLDLLRHMLNQNRVTNMSLSDLTASRFATSALVGKLLNIADETNTSREAVSDLFKKLVAVDTIDGERKFGEKFTFKPRCKYVFNVNGIPTFDQFGRAMKERIIAVPFYRSFNEDERDYDLGEKMMASEMPQIVAWAMGGLRRLKSNNFKFTKFAASQNLLDEFEKMSDSLVDYLSGWERSEESMPFSAFYKEYADWCMLNGRHKASSKKIGIRMAERFGKAKPAYDIANKYNVAGVNVSKRQALPHVSPTAQLKILGTDGKEIDF